MGGTLLPVFTRVIAGSPVRKTRLHSQRGKAIPLGTLIRNGPRTLWDGLARVLFGVRRARPWISYDAQKVIDRHLTPDSHVLEFGSGMSTHWYAKRAASVFAIEHLPEWFANLRGPPNVTAKLAQSEADYTDFPKRPYDLIMVDGIHRVACVKAALPHLAPGGILYLDNADREGDYAEAVELLLDYAAKEGCKVQWFTDFVTAQLFVEEGLMVCRL